MNAKTRQDAIDIIEARMKERCDFTKHFGVKCQIEGELTMAIDLAHLFGAISLDEQRHYKERLMKIQEREHEAWQESNRRIG